MTAAVTVREDGKAEMAYKGETPWHGLGQELKEGASIAEWTQAAGFDFDINAAAVQYHVAGLGMKTAEDRVVIHRSDNGLALGHCSAKYKVVQPKEVMQYFADLSDRAGLALETAGTLHGGKRFWAMARIGKPEIITNPNDKVRAFLLLSSSADGMSATIGKFCTERVVCQNTLSVALRESGGQSVQRHNSSFSAERMTSALGIKLEEKFSESMAVLRKLAKTPMGKADMLRATLLAFEPNVLDTRIDITALVPKVLKSKQVKAVTDLALGNNIIGAKMIGYDSTALWLNAVTQHIDWNPGFKSADRTAESALFGKGSEIKERAYGTAMDYAAGGMHPRVQELSDEYLLDIASSVKIG